MLADTSLNTDANSWYSEGTPERSGGAGSGAEVADVERICMRNVVEPGSLLARAKAAAPMSETGGGQDVTGTETAEAVSIGGSKSAGVGGSGDGGSTFVTEVLKVRRPNFQSTNGLW